MVSKQAEGAALDRIAKTVTTVTVIIGAVFTINTGVASCTSSRVDRYASFRQAVATEEAYWRTLYADYLSTFEPEAAQNAQMRRVKLFAVSRLAGREVPAFEEYAVPAALRRKAETRIQTLRDELLTSIKSEESSDPTVAQALTAAAFQSDDAARAVIQAGTTATLRASPNPVAAPLTATAVSYQTQTLSTGRSDGWDVDVFWCQGGNESLKFAQGQAAAMKLAGLARAETSLVSGVRLGRVRLRMLPSQIQGTQDYPRLGPFVVWDPGHDEGKAAKAILEHIRDLPGAPAYELTESRSRSEWYISVFVCETEGSAVAPAPGSIPAT